MKQVLIVVTLFFSFNWTFGQSDDAINLYLKGGRLKPNSIDSLDTKEFEFGFEYLRQFRDTIKLTVVHHKGTVSFSQVKYYFKSPKSRIIIQDRHIKPGEQLTFTFFVEGEKIIKSYTVSSTADQLK